VKEILPGLFHWTASHPKIKIAVSSYYLVEPRVLIDPLIPAEGLDWFRRHGEPRDILLSNRHHYRHCAELEQAFGCTVWCNREGLHEFQAGEQVRGFTVGDVLPGEIQSHEVGVLCPDETALRIPVAEGALAVADGVVRDADGPLVFVPDFLIGEDPETVKAGLRAAYGRLADALEFDHLLLAHGEPWIGGGREALRRFAAGEEP
jgi:hypothetical protein